MRAANLVPVDQRRGGASGGGGPSTPTVILLAGLTAVLVATVAYVLAGNTVNSRKSELSRVNAQAVAAEQQAAALKPYRDFAALRQARVATVTSLAASRFDWDRVMSELARALPGDVWLTSLLGTVSPGVNVDSTGTGGDTGSLRSAVQSPAVEIVGCTVDQSDVSRVMARLRLLHGVTRVSLASSEKTDSAAGSGGSTAGASGGANASDCRNGSARFPQFQVVVFFEGPATPAGATPAAPGGASPSPGGSTPPVTTPTANGASQ